MDELLVNTCRDGLIDPYRAYLHQRWNDGCTDAGVLHTEIRAQGFTGSDQTVRRYVRPSAPRSPRHRRKPATSHGGS